MEKREEARKAPIGSPRSLKRLPPFGKFQQAAEEEVRQLADRRRGKGNKVLPEPVLWAFVSAFEGPAALVQCRETERVEVSAQMHVLFWSFPHELSGAARDFLPPPSRVLAHIDSTDMRQDSVEDSCCSSFRFCVGVRVADATAFGSRSNSLRMGCRGTTSHAEGTYPAALEGSAPKPAGLPGAVKGRGFGRASQNEGDGGGTQAQGRREATGAVKQRRHYLVPRQKAFTAELLLIPTSSTCPVEL